MAVSLAALTTKGNPLPDGVLQKTLQACDQVLDLDSIRTKVLEFVDSKMGSVAPNLSAIVWSAVAAKLMGTAGGLTALAKMHACDARVAKNLKERRYSGGATTSGLCNAPTAPPGESPTAFLLIRRLLLARVLHPCLTVGLLFLRGSNDLFTIPTINTRPFPCVLT
ncbi:unnamed protein product [Microthlaspi erraticum]|uniref:Nop domain-containing protein n=1 Tax=Microthlaspi erraticum TaxID=1685480 RepID=A0A6D2L759_9BRAS|nr:unnamed protein product [Microthlaspi erraticum]